MTTLDVMRQRLRSLADDCDKRASESDSVEAIRLYRQASPDARHAAVALHMGEYTRRLLLARCEALAFAARLYDGDGIDWALPAIPPSTPTIAPERPAVPRLSTTQLAKLHSMSPRGALKRIVHSYHRGVPGFYREGSRWFAERDAFDQFREARWTERLKKVAKAAPDSEPVEKR